MIALPGTWPYHRPIVALDTTSRFMPIVTFALRVLPAGLKRIEVLSAFEVVYEGYMRAAGATARSIREMRQRHAGECRAALAERLAGQIPAGTRVMARVLRGDPRWVIPRIAKKRDHDPIALGTHARRGLARFLLGSVAVEVLRSSRGDVLVVSPVG